MRSSKLPATPDPLQVISLGAGVQSSTMALMAAHGEITPMPDCAIFADTQAEPAAVYEHLVFLKERLPFPVYTVTKGSLYAHEMGADMRDSKHPVLVPYRTLNPDGTVGLGRKQCTDHYKRTPIDRKLRELREGGEATVWIGISTDEASRMKPAKEKYKTHRWPLIEQNMTRGHCLEWMAAHNYPTPPRSACIFCPFKGPAEWREMEKTDFDKACDFDDGIRKKGGDRDLFVWREPIPLREADFRSAEDMGQQSLFQNDCEGMCGV